MTSVAADRPRLLVHGLRLEYLTVARNVIEGLVAVIVALAVLVGVGLTTAFGLWWADPVAALLISAFILREAREAWAGVRRRAQ